MRTIDYFFSVLSPFTYLAGDELERIAKRRNASIAYRPMDIMALFGRTGGVPPGKRHVSRQTYRIQDLARTAKLNGLPINLSPAHWPTDPAPASLAIVNAAASGRSPGALVREILRSCWALERDIADPETVRQCLEAAGLPADCASDDSGEAMQAYLANTEEAEARNVFGSPFYVVEDQLFWGQDRLHHLDAWLGGELS